MDLITPNFRTLTDVIEPFSFRGGARKGTRTIRQTLEVS